MTWDLTIENIAGIRSGSTSISNGLNVVQASNFQGKSSLIASIQTVIGATGHYEDHPLTEGAESGTVSLETEDGSYEVTIERNNRGFNSLDGNPFIPDKVDQKTARLFAFLGENNPIRTAVRNGDDLTEYLQEPLDIDKIDRQIKKLKNERDDLDTALSESRTAAKRLPDVQETVTQLENEIEDLKEKRANLKDVSEEKKEADELSNKISNKKSELNSAEREITRLENDIQNRRDMLENKKDELEELEVPEVPTLSDLENKRERVASLGATISLFEDLYRANKNALDSEDLNLITTVERTLEGDKVECWLSGEVVPKEQIESRIEHIGDRVSEFKEERDELSEEIEKFQEQKREAEKKQKKRDKLEDKTASLRNKIFEQESYLSEAEAKRDDLESEIEELEEELAAVEEDYSDELTEVKTEIRTKEQNLEKQRDLLDELDDQKQEIGELEEERQELTDEIKELRKRKTETQHQLREEFDTAIGDIISRFAPGFETARLNTITNEEGEVIEFELTIAREGQETTVDALSEGEVELIGVAAALAGYRVYDVGDIVPCILIDAISQLAAEHLRGLVDYIDDTADMIVTTAYPEAGEFEGQIITPDAWDVVSNRPPSTA